ncbi:MAG: D-glycero-beta-D-manno-heptose-1,7-bisphosphate 7-phosphatase (EC [uncultured Paraburkholderia sp.]|nr:MAG: D-glycero-beta-D-manno-heptose-1,7-bisphosphate 7-phosphatase (EC [uncultured Paraburkholderia sp.]CAH2793765.1 MAG: D-glycero-beta-D-manno-heptose-1,7-bisphosphate 7-phosphatase (EC [uncultured Paraburkholderia sp.]CAH2912233.1 MAG: D-glycero-beta-D-manno-heptose-1,7-bisphosphate 7-phosphatase (EC [uncultured Paraburkholderia sp.]CAH2920509.1 MAG: D-glycero-beta-D-manno-heptose-1,7-bisphosphate 7-phosphatase (EC [uncultured Paraburkholderia sp.]
MLQPAVFLDKDGTLLDDVPYNIDPTLMRLAPGAREALTLLASQPFALFVISNQSGVALGKFQRAVLKDVEVELARMFAECGATLAGAYWCPHHPEGSVAPYATACDCRKPAPGLLLRAAREHRLDLARSWFIGDILDDVEAGNRAGCRTILLDNSHETEWIEGPQRVPAARAADLHEAAQIVVRHAEAAHAEAASRPAPAGEEAAQ